MTAGPTDRDIKREANAFWEQVGRIEPFPRSLEHSVLWALPLGIVKLPRLGLSTMRSWLHRRGIDVYPDSADRPLRGCLIAGGGQGFVFLDGCDPDDERRFSLAHEVAHFLKDYVAPRERLFAALGPQIGDVLDGRREPTVDERLAGVLRGVPLGTFTHLLDRRLDGLACRLDIIDAEDRADKLALELLAPRANALSQLTAARLKWLSPDAPSAAAGILAKDFGLPHAVAERYGTLLVLAHRRPRTFRQWLKS